MISNWKSPNKKIRLFITLVLMMMMMMMMMLLFFASSSPVSRLFVSLSKSGDGAKTFSSKKSGFVLCKDDDVTAQDGCFRFRKGTLTDPWKKEREMQTMDPDDLIRNEQLVEKLREGEMKQRKPTSRDVEDMRRARDAFDEFDASERKEREEKRARLRTSVSKNNNRISGVKARVGEMREAPKPHKSVPLRAVDGFMFGQLALAVFAFRKTRAPFAASLSALAFSGTARAIFTENWRVVLFSGILGAFFGLFFLSMPIVEKLVDESVAKDLEDDGIDDDDSDDDEESAAKKNTKNKGVNKIATYRQNYVQKNGVFVGKYSSSRRDKTSNSDSGSSNSTSTLQRVFAWMF